MPPVTVRKITALRRTIAGWRAAGDTIALVPTMGALHEGHLSLVRLAKKKAPRVAVSIFVNPTQFAATDDLSRYPRDEAADRAKLSALGVDLVWAPDVAEMYPDGFATAMEPKGVALPLEGEFRPGHFAGVATIVLKLFNQVSPDVAIFGEKDFQQLAVIRQTVRDLNLDVKIIGAPTAREKDGLARSSRNVYLSAEQRAAAPALYRALVGLSAIAAKGGLINKAIDIAKRDLGGAGFKKIDYIAVADAETFGPFDTKSGRPGRVLAAAWLGRTRLIDNVKIG